MSRASGSANRRRGLAATIWLLCSPSCWIQRPKTPRRRPPPAPEMSRPRSESSRPVARRTRAQKKRALWGALPKEIKGVIQDYLAFTNESLRAAVKEYFEDKAACERRHGKIGTWNVKYVTDMSELFERRTDFNEARAGVEEEALSSRRVSRFREICRETHVEKALTRDPRATLSWTQNFP